MLPGLGDPADGPLGPRRVIVPGEDGNCPISPPGHHRRRGRIGPLQLSVGECGSGGGVASIVEPGPSGWDTLQLGDPSTVPAEPPSELLYHHQTRFFASLRRLWAHREIVYTLAERDFRAQYKQATLGIMWALLSPVLTLAILIIVFSRAKTFGTEHLPFALYAFVGILCWSYFAASLGTGGNALLTNKALLSKTQFPRECFPLGTMTVSGINTVLSWIPLAILFVVFGRAPAIATLWTPLFMAIEVVFAAGVTLAVSGLIIQMRDLVQV